ncbi:MAG: hypothetical protein M3H12_12035 [Chromatiales bacterium]
MEIEETGGMVRDARETFDTTVKEKEQGSEKKMEGQRNSEQQRIRKRVSGDSSTSGKTAVKERDEKCDSDTEGKGVDIMEAAGGTILVHVGTNNAVEEGTSAIVGKYRRLIKTLKEARIGQIIVSAILPKWVVESSINKSTGKGLPNIHNKINLDVYV